MHPAPTVLCAALAVLIPSARAAPKDEGARVEQVADGVYVILHDNATEDWPHGNTGVVIGETGVLVVDSTYLPSRARADIALIRKLTDKPVRYLAYTHWHFDHNNGGVAYRQAFPAVDVVSARDTARYIELNGIWWSRRQAASGSSHRKTLAGLDAQLTSGNDEKGQPLSAERRRTLTADVAHRKGELDELATLQVVTPNLTFEDTLTLTLGRRRVELRNWGRGNSPEDVTIHVPDAQVLFTGDLLVQSPLPYLGASWPVRWVGLLQALDVHPATTLVPGHGPVQRDRGYLRQVKALLEASNARVEEKLRAGHTLEQIQEEVTLDDVRKTCPAWTPASLDEDWRLSVKTLVERSFRGVRGQG
ncbi:MAG TPA: MBL fold metallo-hydrolase [Myxococcaceae bacterium]|nr:MBL fold metallo-hydrolase [Myxococcaceae bacterium]